jgi:DNA modification methylase
MKSGADGPELSWPGKPPKESLKAGVPAQLQRLEILAKKAKPKSPNRLIHGENLGVMDRLIKDSPGAFQMIYLDPPFATGMDFLYSTDTGSKGRVKAKAYKDKWRKGEYLTMMYERLWRVHQLLAEEGSIYLHVDYRAASALRFILDEIFGPENFVNEIIWFYKTGGLPEKLGFGRKHDTILFYAKNAKKAIWNPQKEKSYLAHKYGFSNIQIFEDKGGQYTMVNCRDVFDVAALRGNQQERVNYPTQKPETLLKRMIEASTEVGGLVGDFFCGSGTTLASAEQLGRRWVGCDKGHWAIQTTRKRILGLEKVADFVLEGEDANKVDQSIEVELKKTSRKWVFELKNIAPPRDQQETEHSGMDLLDEWSLDWKSDSLEAPFFPCWSARRSRKEPELSLQSPPLTLHKSQLKSLRVKVVDVYGRVRVAALKNS